jgi:hypothetical protein
MSAGLDGLLHQRAVGGTALLALSVGQWSADAH